MPSWTGTRGSSHRKAVICGLIAVGTAVLLLSGLMMESSFKQVYWAVYSRVHPMRGDSERYSFSTSAAKQRQDIERAMTGSGNLGVVHEDLDAGSAAAAAVASGEKKEVALLPAMKEELSTRKAEKTAANEAHQREAEKQDAKEDQHVQTLADEQLAKATAAFSAEIEAVAGSEEAGRLKRKLGNPDKEQTVLEREAEEAASKTTAASTARRIANTVFLRGLFGTADEASEAEHSSRSRKHRVRRHRANNTHTHDSNAASREEPAVMASNTSEVVKGSSTTHHHKPRRRRDPAQLEQLLEEADTALHRLREEFRLSQEEGGFDGEAVLQKVNEELAQLTTEVHSAPEAKHKSAAASYSGNASDYLLTKERLASVASEGLVMVTWANHHYMDFATSWLKHVQSLGITCYMIGAMDNELLQALVETSETNVFAMQSGLDQHDLGWGSSQFHKMGREKINLILAVTGMGFDILVSDIDTAWLKDPLPYIKRYPDADILTSSDHLANTSSDDGLENYPEAISPFNIGIIMMRKSALPLAKEWSEVLSKDENYWDQNAFNDLLRRDFPKHFQESNRRQDRLFKGYGGRLLAGVLPVALFAGGHTFYVQDLAGTMGLEPYVAHNTFQYSGTPGKRHRFRERHIWLADEPEYYDPAGGILSLDLHIDSLLEPASHLNLDIGSPLQLENFRPHFDLVNAQLTQIRHALALCAVLNRTLLLPNIVVGADRWWAPHHGVIPGSFNVTLPRHAPADHVFDLEFWSTNKGLPGQFASNIQFREHSMLHNRRCPPEVRNDRVDVTICESDEAGCVSKPSQLSGKDRQLKIKPSLKHADLVKVFQEFRNVKVLHFNDLRSDFAGFASKEDAARFEDQVKLYTSLWCCVQGSPGHVWYDFFWDKANHQDRFRREIAKWTPMMGP